MSGPRVVSHCVSAAGSTVVHAAASIPRSPTYHVLGCSGRAITGAGIWPEDFEDVVVTCKGCLKALATGKAVWA